MAPQQDIPATLRKAAKRLGLSQREIADRAGVGHNRVSEYLSGRRDALHGAYTVRKIARVLGFDFKVLLTRRRKRSI